MSVAPARFESGTSTFQLVDTATLSLTLSRLLGPDRSLCDFTFLVGAQWERFPAVRAVVAAHSSPLKSMLFDENFDRRLDVLQVPEWSPEAFRAMLGYMHSGVVEANALVVPEVLQLADYFQLDGLKTHCRNFLSANLTSENAAVVLGIATQLGDQELHDACREFCLTHAEQVFNAGGFVALRQLELVDLLGDEDLNADEWCVYQAAIKWLDRPGVPDRAADELLSCVRLPLLTGEQLRAVREDGRVSEKLLLDATLCKLVGEPLPERSSAFAFDECAKGHSVRLSRDRKTASFDNSACALGNRAVKTSGQVYWEVLVLSGTNVYVGIAHRDTINLDTNMGMGKGIAFRGMWNGEPDAWIDSTRRAYGRPVQHGDRVGVLVDIPAHRISFYLNGEHLGVAFDSLSQSLVYWPCVGCQNGELRLLSGPRKKP